MDSTTIGTHSTHRVPRTHTTIGTHCVPSTPSVPSTISYDVLLNLSTLMPHERAEVRRQHREFIRYLSSV